MNTLRDQAFAVVSSSAYGGQHTMWECTLRNLKRKNELHCEHQYEYLNNHNTFLQYPQVTMCTQYRLTTLKTTFASSTIRELLLGDMLHQLATFDE